MYNKNTIYIVGHGKTSSDNAITSNFKIFFIAFVIDTNTDEVVDLECTASLNITKLFIREIFLGRKFDSFDMELENEISARYFGSSQKALITAYKDAQKRYLEVKKKHKQQK
ncbi:DUF3870 domain-containing protein [Sinanaerobacter chloroacetimidivorans]|jgi:hypothetical protein|uniref:DUF3870 domain-containing protein n=1 Tax=Sinanaerobacter chloroacetimidivorans TaxID=2818044 RepID=A0A8J8B0P2_9FIRM|nr:DUF3870 domain-containing protein [Sinanaerobacter chloroacetimidivorans]MBR0597818.1 DUF3870 domain-containing protein [Sinanaerobacter chloroacetimidivorans]